MDLLSALILGAVQGLTEFLPVSSSGHLIVVRELLGLQTADGLAVDAVLQLATALAVIGYFWRDLLRLAGAALGYLTGKGIVKSDAILIGALITGTIPVIVAGLFLEETMETVFRSTTVVAWMLILGSGLMALAEATAARVARSTLTISKGIGIGLFQCLALIPGVSRSGATISGGLLLGLTREDAARFGFLLSVPIILGSGLKKLLELEGQAGEIGMPLMVGFITAFTVGVAAIYFLMRYVKTHTLWVFIWYRILLAALLLVFL